MKKVYLLLMICLVMVSVSACKKSESERSKDKIEGKWNITKTSSTFYKNGTQTSQTDEDYSDSQAYAQFNADGTGRIQDTEAGYSFNYTVNGSDISLTNLNFNGDNNVDIDALPVKFTITSANKKNLVLQSEVTYKVLSDNYRSVQITYLSK